MKKKSIMIILFIAMTVLVVPSVPCSALVALPQGAGIDYKTMKVTDPSKLKAKGMKKVEVGDIVTFGTAEDGGLHVVNDRTGEKVRWTHSK